MTEATGTLRLASGTPGRARTTGGELTEVRPRVSRTCGSTAPFTRMVGRVLAGPPSNERAESLARHVARLGTAPRGGPGTIQMLEDSGLFGRGGAAFPTARKWSAIADQEHSGAIVVVNAHEGEPASRKDRTLLALRPHLVLDGAMLAAESIRATAIVVYTAQVNRQARRALAHAIAERRANGRLSLPVTVTTGPHRYVSGEGSAAVHRINGGSGTPVKIRPRERGVRRLPTLVQNAETLAHSALIARFGPAWFHEVGPTTAPGTSLMTVSGAVRFPGVVVEVPLGSTIGEVVTAAGGPTADPQAMLLGGYAGVWIRADEAWETRLDGGASHRTGTPLGCGILVVIPEGACCLAESGAITSYLSRESAGNCGPCIHGLPAMARTLARIIEGGSSRADVAELHALAKEVQGRGGCGLPDGAIKQLVSALSVFGDHVQEHIERGRCIGMRTPSFLPDRGWS